MKIKKIGDCILHYAIFKTEENTLIWLLIEAIKFKIDYEFIMKHKDSALEPLKSEIFNENH